MITIEKICSHDVKFNYFTKSKNATPSESEIEHVTNMIIDNYNCGELNLGKVINNREYEFRGWWQIIN
jgi:hypothetical protein